MGEDEDMASRDVQNKRLLRLREKYRKKLVVTAIIAALIGLVLGFALCVLSLNHVGWVSRLFHLGPTEPAQVDAQDTSGQTPSPTLSLIEPSSEESANTPIMQFNQDEAQTEADAQGQGLNGFFEDDNAAQSTHSAPAEEPAQVRPAADEGGTLITALSAAPTQPTTPEPTETPTPEPTAEPTPEPTPAPVIVPFGQAYSLQTEIYADGTAREVADDAPYELVSLTLKVDGSRGPLYFQEQYSTEYKLQGNEAVVQFDVTVNGYAGSTVLIPQNFIPVTLIGESPDVMNEGYQLMDAEIAGKTEVAVTPGVTATLYKRYVYSAEQGDMVYMVVSTYLNGAQRDVWFEINEPVPVETATPEPDPDATEAVAEPAEGDLTVGSEGEEVKRLQRALIDKGLLKGQPDGKFGNYTAEAVRSLQKEYGMEETGIADAAFLKKLYGE